MVKKTLFEIPVYSMSEKEFNRRWDKLDRKLRETYTTSSHHEEDSLHFVSSISFPRNIWKYNQIIGYIKISVSNHDV